MHTPDLERERAEAIRTIDDFIACYNANLPDSFPKATLERLEKFQEKFPDLFRNKREEWILDRHRKKLIDWLPQYVKSLESVPTV